MIDLSSYNGIRSAVFVRLQIDEYRTTSGGSFTQEVLAFSDHFQDLIYEGDTYQTVGTLMGIAATSSELRSSSDTVTVSLSGVPNSSIKEIIHSRIKGSTIEIYRGYFDPQTRTQIGDITGRFKGFVNNYSLDEDYNIDSRTASNTITLQCASNIDVLSRKTSGRRTNPESEKRFFPSDVSMDRVVNLAGTTYNFGRKG
jgi:hypothetical protein